ncbi:TniQ family protein [Acetobacterium malicum]|uniref:TniQ family protein n=1 Tax=Acetobacterium malicum TaxID=52692 RepID=UPI0004219491|nr:TniQ family protein [Acetobacterium dehalogenans]
MIAYFPEPYQDELAYSLFARYYMRSGFATVRDVMAELYVNRWYRADTLFFNKLLPEAVEIMTKHMTIKQFVEKHTMFPYYARFIEQDRRKRALESLINMDGNYHNLLPIPKGKSGRFLRYCPMCVKEDREKYGETFWHRAHQMDGINICSRHACRLIDSGVPIGVKQSSGLESAEQAVRDADIIYLYDSREKEMAEYVTAVFWSDMNYTNDKVGTFLRGKIDEKYVSANGIVNKITELYKGYTEYFSSIPDHMDLQRFQKIYNGYRWNSYEICQLALLEGITAKELVSFKTSDEEIMEETYRKISQEYNIDYYTVAAIGKTILNDYYRKSRVQKKSGIQMHKWEQMDLEILPQVQQLIEWVNNNLEERPVKICAYWACRQLKITTKQMDNLPRCKAEIKKYKESQEHYWAREIIWAVNQVDNAGIELCWKKVRELTNIRKHNYVAALSYVKEMTDTTKYERIRQLI